MWGRFRQLSGNCMPIYGKIVTDHGMGRDFRQEILKLKFTKLVNTEVETHCLKIWNLPLQRNLGFRQCDSWE